MKINFTIRLNSNFWGLNIGCYSYYFISILLRYFFIVFFIITVEFIRLYGNFQLIFIFLFPNKYIIIFFILNVSNVCQLFSIFNCRIFIYIDRWIKIEKPNDEDRPVHVKVKDIFIKLKFIIKWIILLRYYSYKII